MKKYVTALVSRKTENPACSCSGCINAEIEKGKIYKINCIMGDDIKLESIDGSFFIIVKKEEVEKACSKKLANYRMYQVEVTSQFAKVGCQFITKAQLEESLKSKKGDEVQLGYYSYIDEGGVLREQDRQRTVKKSRIRRVLEVMDKL